VKGTFFCARAAAKAIPRIGSRRRAGRRYDREYRVGCRHSLDREFDSQYAASKAAVINMTIRVGARARSGDPA